jgi:curved DNA-binding protein CbpA
LATATHYDTLKVSKSASRAEVRQAYRALAKRYHPDKNPGDSKAEEHFKQIAVAYEVLYNPDKRYWYDKELEGSIDLPKPGPVPPPPPADDPDFYYDKAEDVPYYKWKMAGLVVFLLAFVSAVLWLFLPEMMDKSEEPSLYIKTKYGFIEIYPDDLNYESYKEANRMMMEMRDGKYVDPAHMDSILNRIKLNN